jgi:hypothetical protein
VCVCVCAPCCVCLSLDPCTGRVRAPLTLSLNHAPLASKARSSEAGFLEFADMAAFRETRTAVVA